MLQTIKKIVFWRYGRSTLQYDVLCVLILAFIFLTPQRWFQKSEPRSQASHLTQSTVMRLLVEAKAAAGAQPDMNDIERKVRVMTGRKDAQINIVRHVMAEDNTTIAYEVEVR